MRSIAIVLLLWITILGSSALSQPTGVPSPSGNAKQLAKFDLDADGFLSKSERATARKTLQEDRASRAERGGRGHRGRGGRGGSATGVKPSAGVNLTPDQVATFPHTGLYDIDTLRTLFLTFDSEDWEAELADFYRTDITVPATLQVDGRTYSDVGIGFRGNSSFFTVAANSKRSLNINMNVRDSKQRLYGFRTLNLLNAHADPSFLRETLFSMIANHYLPTYRTNLVRVAINGESWGIYVNTQQFNSDFTHEFFASRKGARWKFPPGRESRAGTLAYAGDTEAQYATAQLKTPEVKTAWPQFIQLCKRLDETPTEHLDSELDDILNVDAALWFLALDNLFIDGDGYLSRASDYILYQDARQRFYPLHYDSNETFRYAGGGGPGVRLPTAGDNGAALDPFVFATDATRELADRPLARLLDNPRLRMRYAAHVRTIRDAWLNWDTLGPLVEKLTKMIDADVQKDTKRLYTYEQFASGGGGVRGAPTLQDFVIDRAAYLKTHNELNLQAPQFESVVAKLPNRGASSKAEVEVVAQLAPANPTSSNDEVIKAWLYYTTGQHRPFETIAMRRRSDGTYLGRIPKYPLGTLIRYYVEARGSMATSFTPSNTELGALSYRIRTQLALKSDVVINEILTSNKLAAKDPQGEAEDYIELKNNSNEEADVSGMYLSDTPDRPLKWMIPEGTVIPPQGYLLIWADNDDQADGLHTNFKLAKSGETIILVDSDDRENRQLDSVTYVNLRNDVAYARIPDGKGKFAVVAATPGAAN